MKLTKQSKLTNEQPARRCSLAMRFKQFAILSMVLATTSLPVTTWSGNLVLPNSPLFLQNAVQPNIFFMLDDSGSMGWEVLKTESAVTLHGGYRNSGNIFLIPSGTNASQQLERCLSYNVLSYNPAVTYSPWKGNDSAGNPYADMTTFTAVRTNPYSPATATENLTTAGVIAYFPWTDAGTIGQYDVGECGANIGTDNSDGITFASLSAAEKLNFANWYSYYRKRDYVMKYALGEVIYTSQHRMGLGTLWNTNNVGTPIQDVDNISVPVNAAAVINKATLLDNVGQITPGGMTPLRQRLQDVGRYYDGTANAALFGATYSHTGTVNSISPIFNATNGGECQQNFTFLLTDGFWNQNNPAVGNADADTASPFDGGVYADTYTNTLADVAMFYYKTDLAGSLADNVPTITNVDENSAQHMVTYTVAFGLKGEIRETFTGVNPGDTGWPGWPDPFSGNTDKRRIDDVWHAAFNGRGLYLNAADPQGLVDSFNEALNNISARTGSASGVSVTSGTISSSTRIYQTLFKSSDWSGHLLAHKVDATGAIVPADDFSGGTTNNAILAIEAQNWNLGRTILSYNGSQGIPFRWPTSPGSPGVNEMSAAQVTDLVDGTNYTIASQRVDFLRGDHSNEIINNGSFRTRERDVLGCTTNPCAKTPFVLGDTIHSSPLYVAGPAFAYPDYLEGAGNEHYRYRINYFDRTPIIYFGANDGMLHGIDASTGEEKIAYVPSRIYKKLPALSDRYYSHQYYVDESPEAGDVFYGGAWHTVLVGALRGGGQGIFALDITDPTTFSEGGTAPANTVLWEFTDADDADLGYTYGRPSFAKMHDGRWYAIFGNGYNNTEADGAASTTGNAVLYLIDVETGAMTKIDTGRGMATSADGSHPNNLARPALVDYDGDYIIDYIYAGDLQGNMWKFDVTGNSPANWRNASKRSILFTAVDSLNVPQPITSRPEVDRAPAGPKGLFLIFGTGQYVEPGDITSTQTQTMYGIWDEAGYSGAATVNVTRSDLVTQTLTYGVGTGTVSGLELRSVTNNLIVTWGNGGGTDEYMGWLTDLPESGEKIIANPLIQDDKVIFISITPTDSACEPGGTSWFMVFRTSNGGRTDTDVIDVNEDGVIDIDDQNSGDVVSGVRIPMTLGRDTSGSDSGGGVGSGTTDEICSSSGSSMFVTSDNTGQLGIRRTSRPQKAFRQGWRQIQ